MEILTHLRPPLDYSEESVHTVEIIRENDQGELGSFGFTMLYQKPPIVGTVVPGELYNWLLKAKHMWQSCIEIEGYRRLGNKIIRVKIFRVNKFLRFCSI